MHEVFTLTDGGQPAEAIAERVVGFLAGAQRSLDLALYDVRLPGAIGDRVGGRDPRRPRARRATCGSSSTRTSGREDDGERPFFPAPPRTEPHVLETLGVPVKPIPGWRDLMHHKYVVRDGDAVWTGSKNWTLDSWTRQENVVVTVADRAVAAAYARNFAQLWDAAGSATPATSTRRPPAACGRGSAPAAGRSSRTASPSGSAPPAGASGSRRRCSPPGRSSARSPR